MIKIGDIYKIGAWRNQQDANHMKKYCDLELGDYIIVRERYSSPSGYSPRGTTVQGHPVLTASMTLIVIREKDKLEYYICEKANIIERNAPMIIAVGIGIFAILIIWLYLHYKGVVKFPLSL